MTIWVYAMLGGTEGRFSAQDMGYSINNPEFCQSTRERQTVEAEIQKLESYYSKLIKAEKDKYPMFRTCCSNFLYLMEFAITAWTLCFHFVTLCRSVVIASVLCQEKAREQEVVSDMSRLELSLGISRNERSNIHAVLAKINKYLKLGKQVRSVGYSSSEEVF